MTAGDLALLSKVTSCVYNRAAKFVAVGIAAALREVEFNNTSSFIKHVFICIRLKRKTVQSF